MVSLAHHISDRLRACRQDATRFLYVWIRASTHDAYTHRVAHYGFISGTHAALHALRYAARRIAHLCAYAAHLRRRQDDVSFYAPQAIDIRSRLRASGRYSLPGGMPARTLLRGTRLCAHTAAAPSRACHLRLIRGIYAPRAHNWAAALRRKESSLKPPIHIIIFCCLYDERRYATVVF